MRVCACFFLKQNCSRLDTLRFGQAAWKRPKPRAPRSAPRWRKKLTVCVDVCMCVFCSFLTRVFFACGLHPTAPTIGLEPKRHRRERGTVLVLNPLRDQKKLLPLEPIEHGRDLSRQWGLLWAVSRGGRTVRGVHIAQRRQCPCRLGKTRTVNTNARCA